MFYRETCEATEDSVLDLIDYCYRKLTDLIARYVNVLMNMVKVHLLHNIGPNGYIQ